MSRDWRSGIKESRWRIEAKRHRRGSFQGQAACRLSTEIAEGPGPLWKGLLWCLEEALSLTHTRHTHTHLQGQTPWTFQPLAYGTFQHLPLMPGKLCVCSFGHCINNWNRLIEQDCRLNLTLRRASTTVLLQLPELSERPMCWLRRNSQEEEEDVGVWNELWGSWEWIGWLKFDWNQRRFRQK